MHQILKKVYLYSSISILTIASIIFILYLIISEQLHFFDVEVVLMRISPHMWAMLGMGLCVGLSMVGAGWGIWIAGSSFMGAAVHSPRIKNKFLISILLCEAVAIYGVIIGIVIYTKLSDMSTISSENIFTGYALFWGGVTAGFCDLICGVSVGVIASSGVLADAQNPLLFVKILLIGIFTSAVGLFGLIVSFFQINKAHSFSNVS